MREINPHTFLWSQIYIVFFKVIIPNINQWNVCISTPFKKLYNSLKSRFRLFFSFAKITYWSFGAVTSSVWDVSHFQHSFSHWLYYLPSCIYFCLYVNVVFSIQIILKTWQAAMTSHLPAQRYSGVITVVVVIVVRLLSLMVVTLLSSNRIHFISELCLC